MDSNTEVRSISAYLEQLRKKELGFFDIPEEYRSNSNIVSIERKLGIRAIPHNEVCLKIRHPQLIK